mgnify:FL=1
MLIHAVPDNRGKKDGYYCSLVESKRKDGKSVHNIKYFFGFISSDRLPYLIFFDKEEKMTRNRKT